MGHMQVTYCMEMVAEPSCPGSSEACFGLRAKGLGQAGGQHRLDGGYTGRGAGSLRLPGPAPPAVVPGLAGTPRQDAAQDRADAEPQQKPPRQLAGQQDPVVSDGVLVHQQQLAVPETLDAWGQKQAGTQRHGARHCQQDPHRQAGLEQGGQTEASLRSHLFRQRAYHTDVGQERGDWAQV